MNISFTAKCKTCGLTYTINNYLTPGEHLYCTNCYSDGKPPYYWDDMLNDIVGTLLSAEENGIRVSNIKIE